MTRYLLRRAVLAGLVTASALLLTAGCASSSNTGSHSGAMPAMSGSATAAAPLPPGVNTADIAFAQMMIPHHQQAVQMASLASAQGADPQLK